MKKLKELFNKLKKRASSYWYLGPIIFILIAVTAMAFTVNPDNDKPEKDNNKKRSIESKADNSRPDIDVKVNREYDNDGNLVRYDSSYTYHYSTSGTDHDTYLMMENVRKRLSEMHKIQNERIKQFLDYDPFTHFDNYFLMDPFDHDLSAIEEESRLKDKTKRALEGSLKKSLPESYFSDNLVILRNLLRNSLYNDLFAENETNN